MVLPVKRWIKGGGGEIPAPFYPSIAVMKTLIQKGFLKAIYVTEGGVREVKLGRLSILEFPFLEQDH